MNYMSRTMLGADAIIFILHSLYTTNLVEIPLQKLTKSFGAALLDVPSVIRESFVSNLRRGF